MMAIARRLWAPALAVAGFAALGLVAPLLLADGGGGMAARAGNALGYLIKAGVWLAAAFLVIRLLDLFFWSNVFGRLRGREVPRLVKDAVAIVILLITAAGIVGFVFEQSVTGIWATSGAISIVIGLALRSIILDIFSGLAINVDRSFRIGDYVELLDRGVGVTVWGRIVEINWRTTRIETDDRRHVVVPNSKMGLTILMNYSMPSEVSRLETLMTLDFSVPPERAMRVLLAGAKAAVGGGIVETPEPFVVIGHTTPLGVEYRVRFWARVSQIPPTAARHAVQFSILKHLSHAGLTVAYPKQDTFHAAMPPRQLEHGQQEDRARLLGGVEIFAASLVAEELARLAQDMVPRFVRAGEKLMVAGEAGASMVVVAEGLLEARAPREGGDDVPLGRIQPGEFAGEMSLLTGEPRSATIVAVTDAVLYEITREHVAALLAERAAIAEAISDVVARRRLNAASRLAAAGAAPDQEVRNFSDQVLQKMRFFFRHVMERHQAAQGGRG